MNINTSSFADQFMGLASNMLNRQMAITARQADYVNAASENALAFTAAASFQTQQYYYGLAHEQTRYLNAIGNRYADIAQKAVKKMGSGGFLGFLGL